MIDLGHNCELLRIACNNVESKRMGQNINRTLGMGTTLVSMFKLRALDKV
jgi:hypothetical protein